MGFDAWLGDVWDWKVVLISQVVGKRLLSVTHLGNFVYGDSKPQIPRLFASRSLHGTEGAFAELIVHDKDKFIQLIRRYVGGYID